MMGKFLPVQLIYKGTTQRCHPHFKFPLDWNITHTKKHWSNEQTMLAYIKNIVFPFVEARRESSDTAALLVIDNFKGQVTEAVMS